MKFLAELHLRKIITKKTKITKPTMAPNKFINVPVSNVTRDGLHLLKERIGGSSQDEVIEKLVAIDVAIHYATRN